MTDHDAFLAAAREQLRASRSLGDSMCTAFELLPPQQRAAFAHAVAFTGCPTAAVPAGYGDREAATEDRVDAAGLMLLKLSVDTGDPLWSSHVMERMVDSVVRVPGGEVADVLRALVETLGEYRVPLTDAVANFIKDLVVLTFTRHRSSYERSDFRWLVEDLLERPTSAMAYLGLMALPDEYISDVRNAIVAALEGTQFADEAVASLADDETS
jgi:hypothetical protein